MKNYQSNFSDLLFFIKEEDHNMEKIESILSKHPEVQFVSFVGIDFGGNGTDEKIPINYFIKNMKSLLNEGVQTDGSSVILHNIATLENAKVNILPDKECNWLVDYNFDNIDFEINKPVGTLRIPSFLIHDDKFVCSRSILKKASCNLRENILEYCEKSKSFCEEIGISSKAEINEILLTSATELEFWVQTPEDKANVEKLFSSQTLKEQYWKRTFGIVRTAMEKTISLMEKYGFQPEMGHKEVGGIRSQLDKAGQNNNVMEQLEIDWKYSTEILNTDSEHFIRHLIKDVFHSYGLEVSFRAKPIEGVAGNGKHTHIGVAAKLVDGKIINLFTHKNHLENYVTSMGISSLMGILKNYEVINPFVAPTIDSLNRLKPHFEAPICIVSSLGHSTDIPSRNRSILIGLIRDLNNPLATRFELRSPNPHTNVYLVIAACYQAMIDGMNNAGLKMTLNELIDEFSKIPEKEGLYLEKSRQYRSENNVFEHYSQEERNSIFGIPPRTVYENAIAFDKYNNKVNVLTQNSVFSDVVINSFKTGIIEKWAEQLKSKLINEYSETVRNTLKCHKKDEDTSELDERRWKIINDIRWELMKDASLKTSLFSELKYAIESKDYKKASILELLIEEKIQELKALYVIYKRNIF
ncbi:MAG: glutamine synthetase [Filifactoraceae bacterium]